MCLQRSTTGALLGPSDISSEIGLETPISIEAPIGTLGPHFPLIRCAALWDMPTVIPFSSAACRITGLAFSACGRHYDRWRVGASFARNCEKWQPNPIYATQVRSFSSNVGACLACKCLTARTPAWLTTGVVLFALPCPLSVELQSRSSL